MMTNVQILVDKTTDFSFPSDHATVAGAVAVGLLFANRRWGVVASVLAVLMAFTLASTPAPTTRATSSPASRSSPRPGGSRSCRSSAGWPSRTPISLRPPPDRGQREGLDTRGDQDVTGN